MGYEVLKAGTLKCPCCKSDLHFEALTGTITNATNRHLRTEDGLVFYYAQCPKTLTIYKVLS